MVDCVSASITIGGIVSPADLDDFIERIINQELSLGWDGEPFTAADCITGQPLSLMTHAVPWARFDALETFCIERGLIFTRWCDGCRLWGPQRAVFHGQGKVTNYLADDKGQVLLDRATAGGLASFDAVMAWFAHAERAVPPLVIAGLEGEKDHGWELGAGQFCLSLLVCRG